ncbi:Ubiquitin hydrolase [Echinococcus granulosus]|uniref:Ubiquitin carboxyl-terminal hydrolase n=1 Tax=Echinococcus granulosus TaxID=6210 RepID=W6UC62_ECHGR|nr:Ubiquitin hydrolase [Echinococcus granulosus]EUB58206.1 Ubiquitin hydrolase [Echinococcus granulosus]
MTVAPNTAGANPSHLEKKIGKDQFPSNEHYYGLVNFGNTCYCNSVLQALFFCKPFRNRVLLYRQQSKGQKKETLLSCLADLFYAVTTKKKKVGQIPPKKFVQRLKRENVLFDNYLPQDAHEFLNYLLNQIADILLAENASEEAVKKGSSTGGDADLNTGENTRTWIHEIFQGTLTNETRCLNCETVRTKDEDFLDLSVDIKQYTSITNCLQCFSNTETIQSENKYYCEVCRCKQEAQKRMRVKRLPELLALHLKRFKYSENANRFIKLSYYVPFPQELRLFNTLLVLSNQPTGPRTNVCSARVLGSVIYVHHMVLLHIVTRSSGVHSANILAIAMWNRTTLLPFRTFLNQCSDDASNPDQLYELMAVVVHSGSGLNRGHYISLVKSDGIWLLFDDEYVDKIDPANIRDFFGTTSEASKTSDSAYILFYQACDFSHSQSSHSPPPQSPPPSSQSTCTADSVR